MTKYLIFLLTLTLFCKNEAKILYNVNLIAPGDYSKEGYLDNNTYQTIGFKSKPALHKNKYKNSPNRKFMEIKAGEEIALFAARLSMYRKIHVELSGEYHSIIRLPEKIDIRSVKRNYDPMLLIISYKLKNYLKENSLTEEIIEISIDKLGNYNAIIHFHCNNFRQLFRKLNLINQF